MLNFLNGDIRRDRVIHYETGCCTVNVFENVFERAFENLFEKFENMFENVRELGCFSSEMCWACLSALSTKAGHGFDPVKLAMACEEFERLNPSIGRSGKRRSQ